MEEESTQSNKGESQAKTHQGKMISFVRKGYSAIQDLPEGEILVDKFREFYIEERKAGRTDLMQIFREYRKNLQLYSKVWFNPYPNQIQSWIAKWEQSLPIHIRKVAIKGRDVKKHQKDEKTSLTKEFKKIEYHDLESGAKNLQSLLIEDAEELMKESNTEYTLLDSHGGFWSKDEWEKIRLKKKALALSIAKEVIAGVQKHDVIQLKRNKEGRETVGFMMELFKQGAAGELSEKDLELLDNSIPNAA